MKNSRIHLKDSGIEKRTFILSKPFREVNPEMISVLKSNGFKSIKLELQAHAGRMQAVVEVIPGMQESFQPDLIPLNSPEIMDYFGSHSAMAKYIIDQDYL